MCVYGQQQCTVGLVQHESCVPADLAAHAPTASQTKQVTAWAAHGCGADCCGSVIQPDVDIGVSARPQLGLSSVTIFVAAWKLCLLAATKYVHGHEYLQIPFSACCPKRRSILLKSLVGTSRISPKLPERDGVWPVDVALQLLCIGPNKQSLEGFLVFKILP